MPDEKQEGGVGIKCNLHIHCSLEKNINKMWISCSEQSIRQIHWQIELPLLKRQL